MSEQQSLALNRIKNGRRNSVRKRVGRGNASGSGTTCGRGNKGQKSRSGGYHKIGFEGGQMPLQRRLPKSGFNSRATRECVEVRLCDLNRLTGTVCDLNALREAKIVSMRTTLAKVIVAGRLEKALTVRGLRLSAGARAQIEACGGEVE